MEKIETIIFDLGNVLISWDPRRIYRTIFDTEAEVEKFLGEICTMEWNEQQDAGRSIAEANKILIEKYPLYKPEIEAYYSRWTEALGGAIEETAEILVFVRAVATALVAAVIAQLILFPSGALAESSTLLRVFAALTGFAAYILLGNRIWLGVAAALAVLIIGI